MYMMFCNTVILYMIKYLVIYIMFTLYIILLLYVKKNFVTRIRINIVSCKDLLD